MASTIHERTCESRIGAETKITGKLNFVGRTSIEGEAEGEIQGEDIIIAPGANVKARLSANRLSIAGCVTGEIVARERVELLQGARARGTITTPKLIVTEGAQFEGDCKMPRISHRQSNEKHSADVRTSESTEDHEQPNGFAHK